MSLGMCSGGNRAVPWSSHTFILDGASGDPVGILGSKPDAFTVVFIPELSVVVVGTHICSVNVGASGPIAGLLPRADEGLNASLLHSGCVLALTWVSA